MGVYRKQTTAEYDYLIVGQGLAGSLLAWRLLQRGQQVLIADSGTGTSASLTAAGLVNPITGQRLVKTPGIDQYLPVAKQLYGDLQGFFGQPFYFERPQIRLLTNPKERNIYKKRFSDPTYSPFLGQYFDKYGDQDNLANELGGFHQKQCGYLDTVQLLTQLEHYFREKRAIIRSKLDLADLHLDSIRHRWKRRQFKHVIFCEGFQAMNNPWFSWLPFQLAKGEILTLKMERELSNEIILKGNWLLPLSNRLLKTGANYQWDILDNKPTKQIAIKLLDAFKAFYKKPPEIEIAMHQAGVRPATKDRQPFIGCHPRQRGIHIFNGFGSKGTLLIPWFSQRFTESLLTGAPLPVEANITRYSTLQPTPLPTRF